MHSSRAKTDSQIRYLGGIGFSNIQRETTNQIIQFVHKFRPEAEEVHRKNGVDVPCISGIVYCRTIACVSCLMFH